MTEKEMGEIYLEPEEIIKNAKEIAEKSQNAKKYIFCIKYEPAGKLTVLSEIKRIECEILKQSDLNNCVTVSASMAQLAAIKTLGCVEKVEVVQESAESTGKNSLHITENNGIINTRSVVSEEINSTQVVQLNPINNEISVMCYDDGGSNCNNSNTMETAYLLPIETWKNGSITCSGDEQWYKFTANKSNAEEYIIYTEGTLDTYGYLYNSNGSLIEENDDNNGDLNFSIIRNLTYGSTYYIKVESYGSNTGDFKIRVDYTVQASSDDNDDSDCSNDQTTAITLNLNSWQNSEICCPGAEAWFKFTPSSTAYYTVYTIGSLDTVGHIYDANYNQIDSNDDDGIGMNFKMVVHLDAGQTYYVKTTAFGNNTGFFYIAVTSTVFVESVSIDEEYIALDKGETATLNATVTPSYATNKTLRWETSNSSVAIVSQSGVVTARGAGTAYICTFALDGTDKNSCCKVSVNVPVESVTINTSSLFMRVGESDRFYADVCPIDAVNKLIRWTSTDISVVWVNEATGRVEARGVGTATIYATAQDGTGVKGSCAVQVEPPIPVQGIDICCDNYTMNVGETAYLNYDVYPADATNKSVTWCSTDTSVAEVNSTTGRIVAKKAGSTIITVSTDDGSFVASCTVKVVGYGCFNKSQVDTISNEFVKLLGEKKIDVPILNLFYTHTTEECVKIIIDNDFTITKIANELRVHKAFIQTILMRELWCMNLADIAGDEVVQNYFIWKESCEYWAKQDTIYQATIPYPSPPVPYKEDSSVGLGQIFAKVAINAYNHAVDSGNICGIKINSNDWHECKNVWYSLRDDDEYNIKMSSLNILSCIDEFGYSNNYDVYSADQCKHVFTRYNADTDTINDYGEECYQYYLIFKKYI